MPIVEISLMEGRGATQKTALFQAVTEAIQGALGVPKESVRIILREIPRGHFAVGGVAKE